MEINDIVSQCLDEIMEAHLSKFQAGDEKYREVNRDLIAKSEEVQKQMNALSDAQQKIFIEYSDTRNMQESMNNSLLYRMEMLDAVHFLKVLGVL